ncbi:hypothetical protein KCU65_g2955, partial [Aureobasidium melanogenum]
MESRGSKAAKHAEFVYDQLVKADALYDEGEYGDCVKIVYDLIENHNMNPLPRMKTLVMLCMIIDDWEYAEACRLEAEDVWWHCDKHPEEGYDKTVLAKFRMSLNSLEEDIRVYPAKPVSEMTVGEIDYRLRFIGDVLVKAPPGPQSHMTYEERKEMYHTAQRRALEEYYTKHRAPPAEPSASSNTQASKPSPSGKSSNAQVLRPSPSGKPSTEHKKHTRHASAPAKST